MPLFLFAPLFYLLHPYKLHEIILLPSSSSIILHLRLTTLPSSWYIFSFISIFTLQYLHLLPSSTSPPPPLLKLFTTSTHKHYHVSHHLFFLIEDIGEEGRHESSIPLFNRRRSCSRACQSLKLFIGKAREWTKTEQRWKKVCVQLLWNEVGENED